MFNFIENNQALLIDIGKIIGFVSYFLNVF